MATFNLRLDGGTEHPEYNCEITVEAEDSDAAIKHAEEHNPGTTATLVNIDNSTTNS